MQKNAKRKPQQAKRHRTNGVAWELPGQVATQALFWTFCPSQDVPPFSGVGLVQLRLLFCQPRPHTALQDDQVVHVDQPPLTVRPAPGVWRGGGGGRLEGGMGGWMRGQSSQDYPTCTKEKRCVALEQLWLLLHSLVQHCKVNCWKSESKGGCFLCPSWIWNQLQWNQNGFNREQK